MQKGIIEGEPIIVFKAGDIITQVIAPKTPRHISPSLPVEYVSDNSFLGRPVELLDIQNNMIYIKDIVGYNAGRGHAMSLETFGKNWTLFTPPSGMTIEAYIELKKQEKSGSY